MEIIKIKAYQYNELNEDAKIEVKCWLNEKPIDYEDEDENGRLIAKCDYIGDMRDIEIQEYCEDMGYLFSESGSRVDHLETKEELEKEPGTPKNIQEHFDECLRHWSRHG
jgi:hypothetical protein